MSNTIKPIGNYILIEIRQKTNSSVILPDRADPAAGDVVVLSVGQDVKHVLPGDVALLRPNANVLSVAANKDLGLTDASSVVAVLCPSVSVQPES